MTTVATFEEIKVSQQLTWSSGDYGKIAWLTVPIAESLIEAVDLRPGSRVLDVASGTGHVAIAAARRFCRVTGIDYVPELLSTARQRAQAEGLTIDFRAADAEAMPFADQSFDYVFSAIGVMFTSDHQRAADELVRVCAAGGKIAVASWTPTGFVGQMLKTVGRHAPPPAGALPPTRWGSAETVRDLFGDRVADLEFTTATVTQRFPSAASFADFFIDHYGPTRRASERLDGTGKQAFRSDLITLAAESNRAADGTLVADWDYLVATAVRL